MKLSKLSIIVGLLACAAALAADPEAVLPGSRWTIAEVVKGRARTIPSQVAYVGVYEALGNARVMVGNMTAGAAQKFKVISVLAGPAPKGEVSLAYTFNEFNEREVKKGERVIWLFIEHADQQAFPIKAVADTDGNRQTVLAALTAAGIATTPATQPATQPVDKEAAAKFIQQLGDNDFAVREAATQKLIGMGQAVKPMLVEKAQEKGLDPEVADRIQKVILGVERQHWPALKGKVVDPQGKPVANARVRPYTHNVLYEADDETRTQPDGTFVLRLWPGSECQSLIVGEGERPLIKEGPFRPKVNETLDVGVLKLDSGVRENP